MKKSKQLNLTADEIDEQETKAEKKPKRVKKWVLRSLSVFLLVLGTVVALFFGATTIICLGPSEAARDVFVTTVMETSAAKFLARMYFSEEKIDQIMMDNAIVDTGEVTDTSGSFTEPEKDVPKDQIDIVDVSGAIFKGKMMIVHDPSRLKVATIPQYGSDLRGMRVEDMVEKENAIAGVNGGGFEDINGVGKGGKPLGYIIKDGKLVFGSEQTSGCVVGFNNQNKLVVGNMTAKEALDKGVMEAVTFGPVLVVNGKPAEISGTGGGLNPRTAIGQRADGAVLILVIDGRQAHSIGANYKDLVDVMMEFGAINAANLDGGSSSLMVYKGEIITTCASLYGSRTLPSAFIVK